MRAPCFLLATGFWVVALSPALVGVGCATGATTAASDTTAANTAPGESVSVTGGPGGTAPVRVHTVPCTPVATTWPVSGGEPPKIGGPTLSVVRTDLRPKDARLLLDGRFVGRARYFNGKKGYLFLEPGRYRLECQLGGYATEVFELEARPNCRFDVRHRMTRSSDTPKEVRGDPPGKGVPTQRVFGPTASGQTSERPAPRGGPEPNLRPDLGAVPPRTTSMPQASGSLLLTVRPVNASVYLDGGFLATGEELDLLVGPLAITAGPHYLEVQAPGFAVHKQVFEIEPGDTKKLDIELHRTPGR